MTQWLSWAYQTARKQGWWTCPAYHGLYGQHCYHCGDKNWCVVNIWWWCFRHWISSGISGEISFLGHNSHSPQTKTQVQNMKLKLLTQIDALQGPWVMWKPPHPPPPPQHVPKTKHKKRKQLRKPSVKIVKEHEFKITRHQCMTRKYTLCNKKFKSMKELNDHVTEHHQYRFLCKYHHCRKS